MSLRRSDFDAILRPVFARHDGVARLDALVGAGADARRVRRAVAAGRLGEPLPGVICAHSGPLSQSQRLQGALLLAAPDGVISHATAADLHGMRHPGHPRVHVTVPHGSALRSRGFVVVHQTLRPVLPVNRQGVRVTRAARSLVDAALLTRRLGDVRAMFADAVQRHIVSVAEVAEELENAPRQGSAHLRAALEEVAAGARSVPEAEVYRLVQRSGLPMPKLNVEVIINGVHYVIDALWEWLRAGLEVDSRAYHLLPDDWDRHTARQNDVQSGGLVLMRLTTLGLHRDPRGSIAALERFLVARAEELGVSLHPPTP